MKAPKRKKYAGGGEIPKLTTKAEFDKYYSTNPNYAVDPLYTTGTRYYDKTKLTFDPVTKKYSGAGMTGMIGEGNPESKYFTEFKAPSTIANAAPGKVAVQDTGRKPVFTGSQYYDTFQVADELGQYGNATTEYIDKKTGQKIDPAKSFDAAGKYNPYGLKEGGLVKRLALGGYVDNGKLTQQGQSATNAAGQIANMGGQYLQSQAIGDDGTVNVNQAAGAGALKGAGQGAQLGTMIAPGIGTAIGAGAGALLGGASSYFGAKNTNEDIAWGKTQAENEKRREEQQNAYSQGLAKQLAERQAGYAKGGEIKGKGGPKDDKIKAKVKPGSFVVPAKNSEAAEEIREKVLKTPPKKKEAELNQTGGVEVRLSNGEHLFSPEEKNKIVKHFGEEILEMLAPESKDMDDDEYNEIEETHMAHGGLTPAKAHQMLKDGTANGKPLTPAQRRYFGYVYGSQGKADGGEIEIKPSHKGMFTAWAKEHGMSVSEAASHVMANKDKYSPHTVKMANFAHNMTNKCMGGTVKKMAVGGEVESDGTDPRNINIDKVYEENKKKDIIRKAKLIETRNKLKASNNPENKLYIEQIDSDLANINKKYNLKEYEGLSKEEIAKSQPKTQAGKNIPSKSVPELEKALGNGPLSSKSKVGTKTTPEYLPSKTSELVTNTIDEQLKPSGQETITDTTTETPVKKGNNSDWNKASGIASQVAGLGNYFIPYKQYQMGQKYLAQTGARPKGQIDPDFLKSVQTAQANAKFGMTPEEQSMLNQQNVNALRAGQNAAQNYSGGSGSVAYNLTRDAANQYYNRGLAAKLADKNLMFNKQQYADSLNASKANMNRQLFEDNLNAWQQNQQAGGNLVSSGLKNLVDANRYNQEKNFLNNYNRNNNAWQNYSI